MRIFLCSLLALLVIGSFASAQPNTGDWVVGDAWTTFGGIFYIDPAKAAPAPLTTLAARGSNGVVNSLSMHPNNRDFLVGYSAFPNLAVVDPNGTVVTFTSIPSGAKGHAKAEDGSVLIVSGTDVHRVDLLSNTSAKFNATTLPPLLNDVAIDHATGDVVVGALNALLALDAKTGAIKRTITTKLPAPYRVAHDPVTDDFFVTEGARSAWNRVDRNGTVVWTKINIGAGGLKIIEQKGVILAGASNNVSVMDANGNVVGTQSHSYPRTTNYRFDAIEIYASSNLNGAGSAQAGTTYALNLSFPQAPGGQFQIVGSLSGHRPGLTLPNGDIVSLVPDALFHLMLTSGSIPGLFNDFAGSLTTTGRPFGTGPTVRIPKGLPAGLRLFLQAYVIHPSLPGGIALSNTWAFSTS